jgi:hypothetical protein
MARFVLSLLVALVVSVGIGLYLGWVQFPTEYLNGPLRLLAQRYKDEYVVMVAAGYLDDGDLGGALERLRLLDVANIPAYVQDVTERYITNSQDVNDIRYLVALSEGVGRLTPIMAPYRQLFPAEQSQ